MSRTPGEVAEAPGTGNPGVLTSCEAVAARVAELSREAESGGQPIRHTLCCLRLEPGAAFGDRLGWWLVEGWLRDWLEAWVCAAVPPGDLVCRSGNRHLTAVMAGTPPLEAIRFGLELRRRTAGRRLVFQGIVYPVSVSAGVVPILAERVDPGRLMRCAAAASREAQRKGVGACVRSVTPPSPGG